MTNYIGHTGCGFLEDASDLTNRGIDISFDNGNGYELYYSVADGRGYGDGMGFGGGDGSSGDPSGEYPFELIQFWNER